MEAGYLPSYPGAKLYSGYQLVCTMLPDHDRQLASFEFDCRRADAQLASCAVACFDRGRLHSKPLTVRLA